MMVLINLIILWKYRDGLGTVSSSWRWEYFELFLAIMDIKKNVRILEFKNDKYNFTDSMSRVISI